MDKDINSHEISLKLAMIITGVDKIIERDKQKEEAKKVWFYFHNELQLGLFKAREELTKFCKDKQKGNPEEYDYWGRILDDALHISTY